MNYTGEFGRIKSLCLRGYPEDIDQVISMLNEKVDLPTTRAVDFYLGLVGNSEGIRRLEHYIFKGTLIQRNYCTLFFARRNEWNIVNRAYELGLIDKVQAYSR